MGTFCKLFASQSSNMTLKLTSPPGCQLCLLSSFWALIPPNVLADKGATRTCDLLVAKLAPQALAAKLKTVT
jgi:hypothetical protein